MLSIALAAKNKSYAELKKAYHTILEKNCPQSVKDSVAENVKDWMQKRGEKELQVLAEHFPQQYQKKVYQQFRQKFEEYNDIDNTKYMKQPEIKDIFEKCGAKKPDKATWGDVQYVFAMYYSDGFPKVFKCENELVKATLMYLDDPDAPEGVAFIRWLAVQDYLGEKINWKDLT